MILPIELTNGNTGRGGAWYKSATRRKRYEKVLRELGHTREPFMHPVSVLVTRILGPRQQLWDSSSGLRGSYKELEDSLVSLGWFVDDSAKWITETRFRQDATRRSSGPATQLDIFSAAEPRDLFSDRNLTNSSATAPVLN